MNIPLNESKKRKLLAMFIALGFLTLAFLGLGAGLFYSQMGAVQPGYQEEVPFSVEHGIGPSKIASDLKAQGLIKNPQAFLLYARFTGNLSKFKAGHYLLSSGLTTPEIIELLVKGKVATLTFTIPEGYHLRQIVSVLVSQGITTEEEFWRVVKEEDFKYPFLQDLPKNERRLEGYLFPDTYTIPKGMSTKQVIDMMLKRFEQIQKRLPENKTKLTFAEVVTLASIVEGESRLKEERPFVASVFLNRLKINMKLDSDATIQYLFDKRKERVLYKDLEIPSPYNTYRNKGLPPGPIGSPGESSLRAVLEPAQTDYFYFVAKKDGSGQHVFGRTLQEHNRNKKMLGY